MGRTYMGGSVNVATKGNCPVPPALPLLVDAYIIGILIGDISFNSPASFGNSAKQKTRHAAVPESHVECSGCFCHHADLHKHRTG